MSFSGFGKFEPQKAEQSNLSSDKNKDDQQTSDDQKKPVIKARQFNLEEQINLCRGIASERQSKTESEKREDEDSDDSDSDSDGNDTGLIKDENEVARESLAEIDDDESNDESDDSR